MKLSKIRNKYKECRYCHTTKNLTVDHIYPLSLGGENKKTNFQPLCKRCNEMKSSMTEAKLAALFRWFKDIEKSRHTPLNWDIPTTPLDK